MMGDKGPAVVLVHGFGAFWEHYRDNIRGLAEKGYRVWALTMVGFGRSEKPNITYTELLWAEQLRDFIVEVVGEPVILAGNSIGGTNLSFDDSSRALCEWHQSYTIVTQSFSLQLVLQNVES
jgi:pimeloyl-ACP methyl ester carboxylesterase